MKTRNLRVPLAALPLAILVMSFSHAQSTPVATLPDTVVTATRTETRADELVSEVLVLDRAAIESSTARTLPELLARSAGLQMTASGGAGKASSVFIRGTGARHTILLIDGVRYGSATLGTPIWDAVPLDMIERIEVLKGPASALYGSDGVGGVVQIFTRKGRQGFHPRVSLTLGSERHRQWSAGLSAGQGGVSYALGFSQRREQGFSATNDATAWNYNPDRDPFAQDSFNASVGVQLHPDWRANAGVVYSDGMNHFDDGPGRDTRTAVRSVVSRLGLQGRPAQGWQTELRFGLGTDTSNAVVAARLPSDFQTRQQQWSWQNRVDTPLGVVLAGLERQVQKIDSSTDFAVRERSIDAVFVGINDSRGPHSWQLNVRHDDNSQFGGHSTGFAGYGLRISPAWRVNVSHGNSFVAPSFNDLYWPGAGNPALRPERGQNTDLGLTWTGGNHEVRLLRFENQIQDMIAWAPTDPSDPGSRWAPANIDRASIQGWSLSYEGKVGRLVLRAAHDALDPRNQLTGHLLARRARQQTTLGADYHVGAWRVGGSVLHAGSRFDDAANRHRLAAYTALDLHADYEVAQDWSVQVKVNNLTDEVYETARGFNQPGRAFYLTLRWQPK